MNIIKIVATFKEEGRWEFANDSPSFGFSDGVLDSVTGVAIGYRRGRGSFYIIFKGDLIFVDNPIFQSEAEKLRTRLMEKYVLRINTKEAEKKKLIEEAICKEYS